MGDKKMTNFIVTSSQFMATLLYPVKIKTEMPISKKKTETVEKVDAVIEVTPIVHSAAIHSNFRADLKKHNLAEKFYKVISQDASQEFMRSKVHDLQDFVSSCGEKLCQEMKESLNINLLLDLQNARVDEVIINYIDQSGKLIQSKKNSLDDVMWALSNLEKAVWSYRPVKVPQRFQEKPKEMKPRHKERELPKEGGTRRYMSPTSRKPF